MFALAYVLAAGSCAGPGSCNETLMVVHVFEVPCLVSVVFVVLLTLIARRSRE